MAKVLEEGIYNHGRVRPLFSNVTLGVNASSHLETDRRSSISRSSKHPQYQTLQSRLDSFVGWPGKYVPKTPEELSAAGFYYIGSADRVTCFHCGITLRDWEEEHDPVAEHRRYSENCEFINTPDLHQLGVAPRPALATSHSSNLQTDSEVPESADDDDLEVDGASGTETYPFQVPTAMDSLRSTWNLDHVNLVQYTTSASLSDTNTDSSASQDDDLQVDSGDITPYDEDLVSNYVGSLSAEGHQDVAEANDTVTILKEMGFSENEVRIAVVEFESKHNRKHRDQSELIEFIFDGENDPMSMSRSPDQRKTNLNITNQKNTERETEDNTSTKKPSSPRKPVIAPLKAENQRLKEQKHCRKCRNKDVGILFLPCGHLVTCDSCADTMVSCILCGKDILGTVKTYLT